SSIATQPSPILPPSAACLCSTMVLTATDSHPMALSLPFFQRSPTPQSSNFISRHRTSQDTSALILTSSHQPIPFELPISYIKSTTAPTPARNRSITLL